MCSQDITARKNAERTLRPSEQRYRQLIHALPAAVYACDVQGRVTLYNEVAVALWGRCLKSAKTSGVGHGILHARWLAASSGPVPDGQSY